jgi:hypothetical protein
MLRRKMCAVILVESPVTVERIDRALRTAIFCVVHMAKRSVDDILFAG